jgi:glycosyltransferase involved in cell wall biosynthesis
MPVVPSHEIANLEIAPGSLSFEARVGGRRHPVWLRTGAPVTPDADAALAAGLMPAMRHGGSLRLSDPVSPKLLRTQREFQAIQRAWSLDWDLGEPLREVEVIAPERPASPLERSGRVAAFFSGGVDSWATVLGNPEVTDLIFVRGFDLPVSEADLDGLGDEVETRLREAADALDLPLHVVETNLRELSDPHLLWDAYYGCAAVTVAHFLAPMFDRVLIAGDSDYEVQARFGANWMVDQLWSSERLEIVDDGGRFSRMQRLQRIVEDPVVRRTLRVCWQNPGGTYNCGSCRKCLMTMSGLDALGMRGKVATFPPHLDLDAVAAIELKQQVLLTLWEDVLDAARAGGRAELERAVATTVARGRRLLGLPPTYRRRHAPGPPPPVRLAVVVPVWRQAQYLAGAVRSALAQEIDTGVGVVIVDDGCPDPETDRIGQALRDAHPDRVAYLRQANAGLSAARNAGIRHAFARWPQVEAVFPLDADNELSPHTLAKLSALLEPRPEVAWASPTLEFFGTEQGEWRVPGPYLPYRQLLENQCDAGSLIRRQVFAAGIEYDETMRDGFEDWEFFLRATLQGFRGFQAGRCGFRYRRRTESMVTTAQRQAAALESEIQRRHPAAYEPRALLRREHEEAPRFALVRCERRDVLLTASPELEPRQVPLAAFARSLAAAGGDEPGLTDQVPAMTVLTSGRTIDQLEAGGQLAAALRRLQGELRGRGVVGLRLDPVSDGELAALALRGTELGRLSSESQLQPDAIVDVEVAAGTVTAGLAGPAFEAVRGLLSVALEDEGRSLPGTSHSVFLEHHHIDRSAP